MPVAVSTRHMWLWHLWDDVYTRRCFSESEGTLFGALGQKALQSMNEFHSFLHFCLIQPQICKDGFISIVFDVSPECCLFNRVRADNWPVLRSLQQYYMYMYMYVHVHVHVVVQKKDDRNRKTSHLIFKMSMNEAFIRLSEHCFIDREIVNG